MGAVAGLAALAVIANPSIGSAAVTGTAAVTTNDNVITVKVSGAGSPTLSSCGVLVSNSVGGEAAGGLVYLPENPGDGEYSTPRLANGLYTVGVLCKDADEQIWLPFPGGSDVILDADPAYSSSSFGSLGSPGNVIDGLLALGAGL